MQVWKRLGWGLAGLGIAISAGADNAVTSKAAELGVLQCQRIVQVTSGHLLEGADHQARSSWNETAPDARLFASTAVSRYAEGPVLSTLFAAPNAQGCDGGYVRVLYLPVACETARQEQFADWATAGELGGLALLRSHAGVELLLMPAGPGCVAQFSELLYDAEEPQDIEQQVSDDSDPPLADEVRPTPVDQADSPVRQR